MSKPVVAALSLTATFVGFVIGVWPMNVEVLGFTVLSRPAPLILLGLLVEGRPAADGEFFGSLAANMWDGLFYEALTRTVIAAMLFIHGLGVAVATGISALVNDRR